MTLPTNQPIKEEEVISIRKAVQDVDIRAIHPDKLETFAADLVNKLKNEHQPKNLKKSNHVILMTSSKNVKKKQKNLELTLIIT